MLDTWPKPTAVLPMRADQLIPSHAVMVHGEGVAFEVEFIGYDGHTVALLTLEPRLVALANWLGRVSTKLAPVSVDGPALLFQGQVALLEKNFDKMQRTLGEKLLPAAVKVTGAMIELIDFLDAHGKSVGIVAGSIAAVAAAVVTVNKASAAFKATSAAWDTVTTAMASFSKEGGKDRKSVV